MALREVPMTEADLPKAKPAKLREVPMDEPPKPIDSTRGVVTPEMLANWKSEDESTGVVIPLGPALIPTLAAKLAGKPITVENIKAALVGAGNTYSRGFADELSGAAHAAGAVPEQVGQYLQDIATATTQASPLALQGMMGAGPVAPPSDAMAKAYAVGKSMQKGGAAQLAAENPKSTLAGDVVAAFTDPANLSMGGPVSRMAAIGATDAALRGAGESEGDVLGDALKTGAYGGATSAVLGATSKGLELASKYFDLKSAQNAAKLLAKNEAEREKLVNKLRGVIGGEAQKGSRIQENIERLKKFASPEELAKLEELEKSGAMAELRGNVLAQAIEDAPGQVGRINEAKSAFQEGLQINPEAVTEQQLSEPLAAGIVPQAKRYIGRVSGPAIGGAIGSGIGGFFGYPMVGATVGSALGATAVGRPDIAIKNILQNPKTMSQLFGRLSGAAETASNVPPQTIVPISDAVANFVANQTGKKQPPNDVLNESLTGSIYR